MARGISGGRRGMLRRRDGGVRVDVRVGETEVGVSGSLAACMKVLDRIEVLMQNVKVA